METRKPILYFALKYDGDWDGIYGAIANREEINDEEILKRVDSYKGKFITILDEEYPERLKEVCKPPIILFYRGDISLLKKFDDSLAVVGSREFSEYGQKMTTEMVHELAKKLVIVSGLARGIDGIAHQATLDVGGKTIAVIGSGFNKFYPPENYELYKEICKKGLVITEYPDYVCSSPKHFPVRNRIVAGLAPFVLIPEAKLYSGSSITASLMLQCGGDVMCVPARAGENSLCNHLISAGAYLVENADDVFFTMDKAPATPIFKSENC